MNGVTTSALVLRKRSSPYHHSSRGSTHRYHADIFVTSLILLDMWMGVRSHLVKRTFYPSSQRLSFRASVLSPFRSITLTTTRASSLTMNQSNDDADFSNLVIILAGPTGSGKSDVAAHLSSWLGGKAWIVSADSVQSYRHVQIGANKPTHEEQEQTPHLLIDVVDPNDNNYNAAEWRRDALWVMDQLLHPGQTKNERTATTTLYKSKEDTDEDEPASLVELERRAALEQQIQQTREEKGLSDDQPIVPIVVGGTMMYLQWLVHGRPDAARPTPDAAAKAHDIVAAYQQQQADSVATQTTTGNQNEEEAGVLVWNEAVQYVTTLGQAFADRVATLSVNDWYRLRRILEVAFTSQEQQHHIGHGDDDNTKPSTTPSEEHVVYTGKRQGNLNSFGYDVRCFFLCPDDRMRHTEVLDRRCEEMIVRGLLAETADLAVRGQLPMMAARAIGYRQTLEYLQRPHPQLNDATAFDAYLNEFTTATRRYAKRQMQWFRRDQTFVFVPVSVSDTKEERVLASAQQIFDMMRMPRNVFDQECFSESSVSHQTRNTNEKQGKGMRVYQFRRYLLKPDMPVCTELLQQADECTRRLQEAKLVLEDNPVGGSGESSRDRVVALE